MTYNEHLGFFVFYLKTNCISAFCIEYIIKGDEANANRIFSAV